MRYITWDGPGYTSIHTCECNHLGKGSDPKKPLGDEYLVWLCFDAAMKHAAGHDGKEVKGCSTCGTKERVTHWQTP